MIVYQFDLAEQRFLFLSSEGMTVLGYSEDELRNLGGQAISTLIHEDDAHRIKEYIQNCRSLKLGQSLEIYYRLWTKELTLVFVRSTDSCIAEDGKGCSLIEGKLDIISREIYDARKLSELAMRHQLFTLYYQPIVQLQTGATVGYEALARIQQGDVIVPPNKFLPAIIGSRLEIDWINSQLERVCYALEKLQGFISFNLSGCVLSSKDLPTLLHSHCCKFQKERLWFEVAEDAIADSAQLSSMLLIRRMGHKLKLDDFPQGPNPVGRLMEFVQNPDGLFHAIKLDRTVCHGVASNKSIGDFARSLIEMAKKGGHLVICEGIENADDAKLLAECGADFGQGFLWEKPQPLQNFDN